MPRDTVRRRLAHEPMGWRPTTLLLLIRRYRYTGCGHVWRQDTSRAVAPRAKLSSANGSIENLAGAQIQLVSGNANLYVPLTNSGTLSVGIGAKLSASQLSLGADSIIKIDASKPAMGAVKSGLHSAGNPQALKGSLQIDATSTTIPTATTIKVMESPVAPGSFRELWA